MSSIRLPYSVADLRKQIVAAYDADVAEAKAKYAEALDLPGRRNKWREEQERAVRSLARRLKTVTDDELEDFRIKSAPRYSRWAQPDDVLAGDLKEAKARRDRRLTRLEAVQAPDGVLNLTRNALRDWFGM